MANLNDLKTLLEGFKDELHADVARAIDVMQKAADTINQHGDSTVIQEMMDEIVEAKVEAQDRFVTAIAALEGVVNPPVA